jgi:hypothetical protein
MIRKVTNSKDLHEFFNERFIDNERFVLSYKTPLLLYGELFSFIFGYFRFKGLT